MSSNPPGRLRQVAPWVSVVGVVAYAVVTPVLYLKTGMGAEWLAWLVGGAAVLLAVVAALVSARSVRADEEEHRRLLYRARSAEANAEARRLALDSLVNGQLQAYFDGAPMPPQPPLEDEVARGYLDEAATAIMRVQDSRLARRDAVQVAVVALGRKVQASAHRIQEEAARMVQRHPTDPDILQTSMRVDHAAAQQARQAQSLAALCGEWPGQQWNEPLALPDVVKGASGRITAFHRVEVSGDPGVAVSARVVEPLIHLVSELLANATQSSPPTTQVLVSLRQVQRGAVVEIDDCGVGLDTKQLDQAREIASGRKAVSIVDLGEIPQTGLAVVGTYARRHGFRVDITESVYGGLRAIVMIPAELTEPLVPAGMVTSGTSLPEPRQSAVATVHSVPTVPSVPARQSPAAVPTVPSLPAARAVTEPAAGPLAEEETVRTDDAWPAESLVERPSGPATVTLPAVVPAEADGGTQAEEETYTAPPAPSATAENPLLRRGRTPEDDEFADPATLPQRRSRRGEDAPGVPAPATPSRPVRQQSAEEAGQWMGAFFSTGEPGGAPHSSTSADADMTSEDR
ncbi:ATP-binding protein [Antribacter gilvus]|uniref:ATP-binding protein n=1 Tax=Antribacter gilvus TaxID=2304675 RepID=UPI000F770802|nr:ATP-binding protein [Antribacter gilvus]